MPELLPVCGVAAGAQLRALQLGLARGGLHFRCTELAKCFRAVTGKEACKYQILTSLCF